MKKIASVFFAILLLTATLTGCGMFPTWETDFSSDNNDTDDTSNKESGSTEVSFISNVVMKNIYKTFPERKSNSSVTSFTDGQYNYFFFKVGEIGRVPIAYSNTKFYQGIGTRVLTFETTQSVEKNIESAIEQSYSVAISSKVGVSTELSAGVNNQTTGATISSSVLLETSFETTANASTSELLTKSISDTFSKLESDTFELKPDSPAGFYRYTIYADCDVYAAVKANKETSKFECTYLSFIKENSKIEGWFYSEDGYFESEDTYADSIEKLSLTEEMIRTVDLYGNLDKHVDIGKQNFTFSTGNETIDEDEQYSINWDMNEKFDFDLVRKIGYQNIKVKISFDLVSPSGDCQASFLLENGSHSLYYQDWTQVTPSAKSYSKEMTISMSDIDKYGSEFLMRFVCRSDGIFDIAKNEYAIKNGNVTIWFE